MLENKNLFHSIHSSSFSVILNGEFLQGFISLFELIYTSSFCDDFLITRLHHLVFFLYFLKKTFLIPSRFFLEEMSEVDQATINQQVEKATEANSNELNTANVEDSSEVDKVIEKDVNQTMQESNTLYRN